MFIRVKSVNKCMNNMPKSLEKIEIDDFCSNTKGAVKILFQPHNIYVRVQNRRFGLNEAPSIIVDGCKKPVVELI